MERLTMNRQSSIQPNTTIKSINTWVRNHPHTIQTRTREIMKAEVRRNGKGTTQAQLEQWENIQKSYHCARVSLKRGYISSVIIKPYSGIYGQGYTVEYQTDISNQYHRIAYYVDHG